MSKKDEGETIHFLTRELMKSATMPCGNTDNDLRNVEEVCSSYRIELQSKAELANQECTFRYEVIQGVYNIRVNIYGGTDKDFVMIGYNLAQIQLLKDWRIK